MTIKFLKNVFKLQQIWSYHKSGQSFWIRKAILHASNTHYRRFMLMPRRLHHFCFFWNHPQRFCKNLVWSRILYFRKYNICILLPITQRKYYKYSDSCQIIMYTTNPSVGKKRCRDLCLYLYTSLSLPLLIVRDHPALQSLAISQTSALVWQPSPESPPARMFILSRRRSPKIPFVKKESSVFRTIWEVWDGVNQVDSLTKCAVDSCITFVLVKKCVCVVVNKNVIF